MGSAILLDTSWPCTCLKIGKPRHIQWDLLIIWHARALMMTNYKAEKLLLSTAGSIIHSLLLLNYREPRIMVGVCAAPKQ
ncbi:hypothetical protein GDO86_009117 [Hymenochirus boettgeri]|uniref:Uncharacterized protein n=1 Tax=Hymenochirus boettgeri TaxID=247094 RepID=A0A8T2JJE9_9PIPI|nr:hypothetical protein GDO86_009117 [Hymenochirus boettgeri]